VVYRVGALLLLLLGATHCSLSFFLTRKMTGFADLATELRWEVARWMGVDATIQDWMVVEALCLAWSVPFATLFTEWLKERELGSKFWLFSGTQQEARFLKDHVQGLYVLGCSIE
jgi:hypothetical protein